MTLPVQAYASLSASQQTRLKPHLTTGELLPDTVSRCRSFKPLHNIRVLSMPCSVCGTATNLRPHKACQHHPWGRAVIHMPWVSASACCSYCSFHNCSYLFTSHAFHISFLNLQAVCCKKNNLARAASCTQLSILIWWCLKLPICCLNRLLAHI